MFQSYFNNGLFEDSVFFTFNTKIVCRESDFGSFFTPRLFLIQLTQNRRLFGARPPRFKVTVKSIRLFQYNDDFYVCCIFRSEVLI